MPEMIAKEESDVRRYRLIPVDVEAIKLTPATVREAALWCGGMEIEEIDPLDSTKRFVALNVPSRNGVLRCSEECYIVKDSSGDFTVMSARRFEDTYERI
jgi:hypothetical protein